MDNGDEMIVVDECFGGVWDEEEEEKTSSRRIKAIKCLMRLLTSSVPEGATMWEAGSWVPQIHSHSGNTCRCETALEMHEAVWKQHATDDRILYRLHTWKWAVSCI
jgi:hypothetical protein